MFWKPEETRLVQHRETTSVANALTCMCPSTQCPDGKIWIITAYGYQPSVAETQVVSASKYNNKVTRDYSVLNPLSLNLNPAFATFIEQGMEYWLMPGETIIFRRVAATAGSTMISYCQLIEIDQPIYTYEEPLIVERQKRALSSIRSMIGGGGRGGGGAISPPSSGPRGGGRGGLPV